jgi:hypothetical protein
MCQFITFTMIQATKRAVLMKTDGVYCYCYCMDPIDLLKYSIRIHLTNNYSVYITNESFDPFIGYEPVYSRIDNFFTFPPDHLLLFRTWRV